MFCVRLLAKYNIQAWTMGVLQVQFSTEMNSPQGKQNKTKTKQERKKNGLRYTSLYQIPTMVPPKPPWVMEWVSVAPSYSVKKTVFFVKPLLGSCPTLIYSPSANGAGRLVPSQQSPAHPSVIALCGVCTHCSSPCPLRELLVQKVSRSCEQEGEGQRSQDVKCNVSACFVRMR